MLKSLSEFPSVFNEVSFPGTTSASPGDFPKAPCYLGLSRPMGNSISCNGAIENQHHRKNCGCSAKCNSSCYRTSSAHCLVWVWIQLMIMTLTCLNAVLSVFYVAPIDIPHCRTHACHTLESMTTGAKFWFKACLRCPKSKSCLQRPFQRIDLDQCLCLDISIFQSTHGSRGFFSSGYPSKSPKL